MKKPSKAKTPDLPQGVFCCPGVHIDIVWDDMDQCETFIDGVCPQCSKKWHIVISDPDDDDGKDEDVETN